MARAGTLLRALRADAARAAAPCTGCEHPMALHRELPRTLAPATLAELAAPRPNPAYRPLHFHCGVEGCECVIDRSAG